MSTTKKNAQRAKQVTAVFEAMLAGQNVSLTVEGKVSTRLLKDTAYKVSAIRNNGDVDLVCPITLAVVAENVRPEFIELKQQ